MFIFTGKFDWLQYSSNDTMTIVAPGVLDTDQPIWGFWQWTVDAKGVSKPNVVQIGKATSVGKPAADGSRTIEFAFDYYPFKGTIGANVSNLKITMRNPSGATSSPWTLPLFYSDGAQAVATRVYTGKLDWFQYAQNEMVTLILPSGLGLNAPVTLIYQWTQNAAGTKKAPYAINSSLRDYTVDQDGTVKARFKEYDSSGQVGYYNFSVEIPADGQVVNLRMSNPAGDADAKAPYKLSISASP